MQREFKIETFQFYELFGSFNDIINYLKQIENYPNFKRYSNIRICPDFADDGSPIYVIYGTREESSKEEAERLNEINKLKARLKQLEKSYE